MRGLLFYFRDRVSRYSLGCPQTHSSPYASASQVLMIKAQPPPGFKGNFVVVVFFTTTLGFLRGILNAH